MGASNTPASGRPNGPRSAASSTARPTGLRVRIANRQERLPIDAARLRGAVERVWEAERDGSTAAQAEITVAIVDDAAIAKLHQQFLGDPDPTDVLTFVMEDTPRKLEADVVVSADTAQSRAGEFGWNAADELLLYVVHGVLHLVGYDDTTPERLRAMREAETRLLAEFGLRPRYGSEGAHAALPPEPAVRPAAPAAERRPARGGRKSAQRRRHG